VKDTDTLPEENEPAVEELAAEAADAQAEIEAAPESAEELEQEFEDIFSSSPRAKRVNVEDAEDEKPLVLTDDIDPEDFFASLKEKLRENIDPEEE
jgi:seryl-tRNA synthetase